MVELFENRENLVEDQYLEIMQLLVFDVIVVVCFMNLKDGLFFYRKNIIFKIWNDNLVESWK